MAAAKIPRITVDSRGRITSISEQDAFANLDPHALLGAEHSDVTAANPTRGDIIVASSIPKWARFAIGGSGKYLRSDGTDPAWSDLLIGDLPEGGTWDLNSTDLTLTNGHLKLGTAAKGFYERARTTAMGEWISVAFNAADFTGNNAMTWTVAAGDVVSNTYTLIGKTAIWVVQLSTTTVGGTPSTLLRVALPSALSGGTGQGFVAFSLDNGVQVAVPIRAAITGSNVEFGKSDGSNWTASTDATWVYATIIVRIP